jgi:hypothetical protein
VLGQYVCGGAGLEARYERGEVVLAQTVAQAVSSGSRRVDGLNGCWRLGVLGCFVAFEQVGAEGGVQGESCYPDGMTGLCRSPVGANSSSSSCDLGIFVYQPTEPITTSDAKVGL